MSSPGSKRNRFSRRLEAAYRKGYEDGKATEQEEDAATHRHKKRGSTYVLIGIGRVQAENWEERNYSGADEPMPGASVDMREVAIYRAIEDGSLWVRPVEEFNDGRFEPLSQALASGAKTASDSARVNDDT